MPTVQLRQNFLPHRAPSAVSNVDETGLDRKRMPSSSFISRQEKHAPGWKVAKDRLKIMVCSNVSGDLKLKPLPDTPTVMKGCSTERLPAI